MDLLNLNYDYLTAAYKIFKKEIRSSIKIQSTLFRLTSRRYIQVKQSNPVFIVSYPRSGSSMLMGIISASRRYFMLEETGLIFRHLHDPTLRMLLGKKYGKILNADHISQEEEFIEKDRIAKEIAREQNGSLNWGEKVTENCLYIPFIYKVFPNAKVVSIYRNPLDSISSWREHPRFIRKGVMDVNYYYGGKPIGEKERTYIWKDLLDCIARYRFEHSIMLKYKDKYNLYEVRYEDILKNPRNELEKIFNYLDIPFSENAIKEQGKYQPWGDPSIVSNKKMINGIDTKNIGVYKSRLTDNETMLIYRLTKNITEREGYDLHEYISGISYKRLCYRKKHPML